MKHPTGLERSFFPDGHWASVRKAPNARFQFSETLSQLAPKQVLRIRRGRPFVGTHSDQTNKPLVDTVWLTCFQCMRHIRLERRRVQFMACVRLLDGTDVMTTEEYSVWRDELRGNEDGECFFDALRRHLAKSFLVTYWCPIFLLCQIKFLLFLHVQW